MRIDLETIEKIEQYLLGNMNPDEVKKFETEMENNAELKQAVEDQKSLMKAVKKIYVKQAAVKAGQRVRVKRNLTIAGTILGLLIVLILGLFLFNDFNRLVPKKNHSDQTTDSTLKLNTIMKPGTGIPTQTFMITSFQDTIVFGMKGTKINIPAEAFVDSKGAQVLGNISIELKECLTPFDMVAGNMTTLSDGNILESGGMIYLNASSNGEPLLLAEGKEIALEVPSSSFQPEMQIYEGIETPDGINWVNPVPMAMVDSLAVDRPPKTLDLTKMGSSTELKDGKRTNVSWSLESYFGSEHYADSSIAITPAVTDYVWAGNGLIIGQDTIVIIKGMKVKFFKQGGFTYFNEWFEEDAPIDWGNSNQFVEDAKTNYIFSVKKLGWANIDRLFSDPRTKEIELIVSIPNHKEFTQVYISMIFKAKKIYLPGYQKKDKTYGFSHGDFEKTALPIGEYVTILAIGYKKDLPFIAIKNIQIKEIQNIVLDLKQTSAQEIKKQMEQNL